MRYAKMFVLIWAVKLFFTADGVTRFLNSLTAERAVEAKVTVADIDQPFYVFYREEVD